MRKTWRMVKLNLPHGYRWLTKGEKIRVGDMGFDGGEHIIGLPYIVGKRWDRRDWLPIARTIGVTIELGSLN